MIKNNSQSYFIREIDIKHSSEEIVLVFRETEDKQAMLVLNLEQLESVAKHYLQHMAESRLANGNLARLDSYP